MIYDIHSHIKRDDVNQGQLEIDLIQDMKKNKINVRVVSTLEGKSISEQNNYISGFVSKYPDLLIGCAVINPKEYNCREETVRALNLPGIKILELNSYEHGYYPDTCPNIDEVLRIAENKGFPVKVFVGLGAKSIPHQWIKHVRQHPKLKFIFLHMGCFDYGYGCVDLAREFPNIYLETSNQYEVQILKKALNQLPAGKLVFGSSYPERLTKCSIDVFEMFELDKNRLNDICTECFKLLL